MTVTVDELKQHREAIGAPWFTAPYDLNLLAVRNPPEVDADGAFRVADELHIVFCDGDEREHHLRFACTTRPGRPWLLQPMNVAGAAIVAPGHYPQVWTLGSYRGFVALRQRGEFRVYRDDNRDGWPDTTGLPVRAGPESGIHLHRWRSDRVIGRDSAGCFTVDPSTTYLLGGLVQLQRAWRHGLHVSLTVIDSSALPAR